MTEKQSAFMEQVEEFRDTYVIEYMRDVSTTACFDDPCYPTAEIVCEEIAGRRWTIPIAVREGVVGIPVGESDWLDLDDGGLYAYLWNEALKMLDGRSGQ